jgi:uncharacterized protein YkwD
MLAAVALTTAIVAAAAAAPAQAGTKKQMIRTINYSRRLSRGATAWARHLMRRSILSHAPQPNGHGEIIEWHTGGGPDVNSTVMEWWHSSGHRQVMMMGGFRRAGAGRAVGNFGGQRCTIWVVRFS